ncbi:hypothetical protein [Candidatus Palauibacter sp.]|uniref:hypothetical protein n=1 Tax=Candidatus Palauibacter sp. TaxID=3101350 RepID=UPI003B01F6D6
MSTLNETVMQFIEKELENDPGVKNATLFAGACAIDGSIGDLTARQFHAKYPLQVKRRMTASAAAEQAPAPEPQAAPAPAPAAAPAPASGEDVMEFVVRTLDENPDVKNADLFAGACEIDSSIAELSPRQFHAKYPLQVKRRLARAEAASAPAAPAAPEVPEAPAEEAAVADIPSVGEGDPMAVRGLLLDLARELANAGSQAETIEVVARLDIYVAQIMEAARS